MKRDYQLPSDGGMTNLENSIVEVRFGSASPEKVVAELLLLREGLVDQLSIRDASSSMRVRLSVGDPEGRADAVVAPGSLSLTLSHAELEYWISFFLRYYRDGVAVVDHIDLEASILPDCKRILDVVLKVPVHEPPVSEAEARRRLR